jgi:hypothetical protein
MGIFLLLISCSCLLGSFSEHDNRRQNFRPKRQYTSVRLHGVTSQKKVAEVRTSYPATSDHLFSVLALLPMWLHVCAVYSRYRVYHIKCNLYNYHVLRQKVKYTWSIIGSVCYRQKGRRLVILTDRKLHSIEEALTCGNLREDFNNKLDYLWEIL